MNANTDQARAYVQLLPGDPAPWFHQRSSGNPRYAFDTVAGRYVVLCFYGSAGDVQAQRAMTALAANRQHFDDERASFFGVSVDPADEAQQRVRESVPGIRFFWDFDTVMSRLYGAAPKEPAQDGATISRRFWMVLDPALRVLRIFPLDAHAALFAYLDQLPPVGHSAGFEVQAPVLVLPNVFEPELCRHLIDLYEQQEGFQSGFMREVDGKTVEVHDRSHKVRKDFMIEDEGLTKQLQARFLRRVIPQIEKVHCFKPTRMERYLVACYSAEDGGHFRAHRDNTTAGTAHRRFAVSINLNAEFEGGEVSFPEYGPRSFKPPPGGAVVFSCSLLHAVSRVTAGRRYAFLPFLYDEAAAKIREANAAKLAGGSAYRATA
ncbi:2OG-Fe(II) oxygenase [Methylobacterium durans]|uniref:2OG-Fe(II) oxygenase n=1 Tax=Methylobacterium durans TaxID=2202825 RepID=UPI002AFDCB7C|nr:2OG-Fe(II) oxygenase [Methylobacterium durans]MEA1834859.1 2OG-Fe(II) oxygenase [Methylobacterium durans]